PRYTWDRGKVTWGGQGECIGIVPMGASVRECRVKEKGKKGGKGHWVLLGLLWGLGKWQKESLGFVKVVI
nr:hypothetical protein [Tanacetum cinerariifolium]